MTLPWLFWKPSWKLGPVVVRILEIYGVKGSPFYCENNIIPGGDPEISEGECVIEGRSH